MSINLAAGAASPEASVTASSAIDYPFSMLFWVKANSTNNAGFNIGRFLCLFNAARTEYCRLGIYNDGSSVAAPRAEINDDIQPSQKSVSYNINDALEATWRPVAIAVDSSNFTLYTVDGDGVIVKDTEAHNRALNAIVDIVLFQAAWANGSVWLHRPQVLPIKISDAQFLEYATTLDIAGTSPVIKLDTTTDWGAGDIADLSGNGYDITPAGSWSHSTDEPTALVLLDVQSVGADDKVVPGGSVTISLTGDIGSVQGTVELRDATATTVVAQTITNWNRGDGVSTGTITITGALGGLSYEPDHELVITTDSGAVVTYTPVILAPPSGNAAVDVIDPVTDDTSIFYQVASGTPATGNQVEHDDAANTTVNPDGTFAQDVVGDFQARVWDHTDNTWGQWQTISVEPDAASPTASIPQITVQDQGVAVQQSDWEVTVALDSDDTVISSQSGVASDVSGVISSTDVDSGSPGDAIWIRARSKNASKALWVKTVLGSVS